jgi:hypothetical protein
MDDRESFLMMIICTMTYVSLCNILIEWLTAVGAMLDGCIEPSLLQGIQNKPETVSLIAAILIRMPER